MSEWVEFRVTPLGRVEQEELAGVWRRIRLHDAAGTGISDCTESRFFPVVYEVAAPVGAEPDTGLVSLLRGADSGHVRAAWVLGDQLERCTMGAPAKRAWVERRLAKEQDPLQRAVLHSWLVKFEGRRRYRGDEP